MNLDLEMLLVGVASSHELVVKARTVELSTEIQSKKEAVQKAMQHAKSS